METFKRNLKALRESLGLSQQKFGERIKGDGINGVSVVTVNKWESKGVLPRKKMIEAICSTYGVSDNDLFSSADGLYAKQNGLAAITPKPSDTYAPVVGDIAAGDPSDALEETGEVHWVSPEILERYPDGFFLRVKGDSMDRVLPDLSYAYIAPCEVRTGDVAAVKVNGDEATLKRVRLAEGLVILEPESTNPEHKRRVIDGSDPDAPDVRLIGKVVWFDTTV